MEHLVKYVYSCVREVSEWTGNDLLYGTLPLMKWKESNGDLNSWLSQFNSLVLRFSENLGELISRYFSSQNPMSRFYLDFTNMDIEAHRS